MSQFSSLNTNQSFASIGQTSIKDVINTPYMKVLTIWNEAKHFISTVSKTQVKWVRDLDWSIKVIGSQSWYTFELTDSEVIRQYEKENPSFKQFIDFVSDYNKEVIQVNKKSTFWINQTQKVNDEIGWLQALSFRMKQKSITGKRRQNRQKCSGNDWRYGILPQNSNNSNSSNNSNNKINISNLKQIMRTMDNLYCYTPIHWREQKNNFGASLINNTSICKSNSLQKKEIGKIWQAKNNTKNLRKESSIKTYQRYHTPSNTEAKLQKYSFMYIESLLSKANYDTKRILNKDFNIFDLKKWVGNCNVWPLLGRTIIEAFGINDKMINTSKLDSFLVTVSNSYISTVLYHNSIHGADVSHTVSQFFLNSNAEEVTSTSMLDILSILIASLGHDIGHPGWSNSFQINSGSEIALAHNDWSCWENYHCVKLFKIERIPENNIFEPWCFNDYKVLRKRIISMILATDMANHGKVMSVISALVPKYLNVKEGDKIVLLSNDNTKKFAEQQALLDYFLHAADLAHNTKSFDISLQWVEFLTKEFWNQGDKEKKLNLPVSFLCERAGCDVPTSQVGFIKGFILPTFDVLVKMFPSLDFTMQNAHENIKRWQELVDKGNKLGWNSKSELEETKKEERVVNNISINVHINNRNYKGKCSNSNNQSQNCLSISNSKQAINANWGKPKFIMLQKSQNGKKTALEDSNPTASNNNIYNWNKVLWTHSPNHSPIHINGWNPWSKSMIIKTNK